MNKPEIIEGLESLVNDRESFIMEEDDIFAYDKKVLKEAINLIKETTAASKFRENGCLMCKEKEKFTALSSDLDYEIYECKNCGAHIKVEVIKKIVKVSK